MKKIIYALLCIVLLVSACSVSVLAAGEPAIVVSSAETILGSGETVEVTIRLQNNPGIAVFDLAVQYDENILEWTDLDTNADIGGMWLADVGETLAWVSFGENFTDDATLCTPTFAVKDTVAASCESEVTVTYDQEAGIANADRQGLQIPVQAGKVSVIKTCTTHTYDDGVVTKQPTCEGAGEKIYTCTRKGCGYQENEVVDPIGHDWDAGVVTKEPTAEQEGEKTHTCQNDPNHIRIEAMEKLKPSGSEDSGSASMDKENTDIPDTGDDTPIAMYVLLAVLCMTGIVVLLILRKKHER